VKATIPGRPVTRSAVLRAISVFAAEPCAQLGRDVRLGEVAERVHAAIRLPPDRGLDLGTSMAECGDAEASGEVDVAASVGVDDAAAFCLGPDHGRSLFSVSSAT
jgi:hypothetical protein